MWKRKVIKKKAMALMKQGYFRILPVCFLIAMLTTAYSFSTTFLNLQISSAMMLHMYPAFPIPKQFWTWQYTFWKELRCPEL